MADQDGDRGSFCTMEAFPQLALSTNIFIHLSAKASFGITSASAPPGMVPVQKSKKTASMVT